MNIENQRAHLPVTKCLSKELGSVRWRVSR